MIARRHIYLAALLIQLGTVTGFWTSSYQQDLPPCKGKTEKQFYNVDIEIVSLPATCDQDDLEAIGALIQDVVTEVERNMPEYKGEYMKTDVCPKPEDTSKNNRRRLWSANRSLIRKGRYRYRGGGFCRRCLVDNLDRRKALESLPTGHEDRRLSGSSSGSYSSDSGDGGGYNRGSNTYSNKEDKVKKEGDKVNRDKGNKGYNSAPTNNGGSTNQGQTNNMQTTGTNNQGLTNEGTTKPATVSDTEEEIKAQRAQLTKDLEQINERIGQVEQWIPRVPSSVRNRLTGYLTNLKEDKEDLEVAIRLLDEASAEEAAEIARAEKFIEENGMLSKEEEKEILKATQEKLQQIKAVKLKELAKLWAKAEGNSGINLAPGLVQTIDQKELELKGIDAAENELSAYQKLVARTTQTVKESAALLQYTLAAVDGSTASYANWNVDDETDESMESWFRSFGDDLVREIPKRLVAAYNSKAGGCVDESPDILVDVVQLKSWVGQFSAYDCANL